MPDQWDIHGAGMWPREPGCERMEEGERQRWRPWWRGRREGRRRVEKKGAILFVSIATIIITENVVYTCSSLILVIHVHVTLYM